MDGSESLAERTIGPEHAESLVALSAEAGWNQVAADWRFMLTEGRGVGVTDAAGRWIASALTLPLGKQLAWISMVLTTKAWRGKGIGTRLLRRSIDTARMGGAVAGLDATEFGRPIYLPLGFTDVFPLTRWHLDRPPQPAPPPAGIRLRRLGSADITAVSAYDAPRSAMERGAILAHLQNRAPYLAFAAEARDEIVGFVLGRDGRFAHHIGPVVANSETIALALIAQATAAANPPFLLDAANRHAGVRRWLESSGATAPRGFMRMTLGESPGLADAENLFAVSGPELA
ncbi:MAG: GNAT family N-acetyltransferase [Alphaproteobacteria bacterium]